MADGPEDWEDRRQFIRLQEMVSAQEFKRDECHLKATGFCSLQSRRRRSPWGGRSGYDYCRQIAKSAQLWGVVCGFLGGDIPEDPKEREEALKNPNLRKWIRSHWEPRFGALPQQLQAAVFQAVEDFGAPLDSPGMCIQALRRDDGQLRFHDGRHRVCVADRLSIPVAAIIEVRVQAGT